MIDFIRKHPLPIAAGAIVAVAALAWLTFGYFGVHTLFIDDEVSEALPTFDTPAQPAELASTATEPLGGEPAAATTPTTTPATTLTTTPATTDPAEPADAPVEIATEYAGSFVSDAHPTSGTAVVLGNGTGQRFLRFEDFETDNGPDLNVYLVNSSTGDVSDYIDLGDLKGNIGEQNYEIPADVDLDVYDQVVIWCVRFGVGFGDATLMAV